MKTSTSWWADTKSDPAKLADWLQRQFRGEVTAATRITQFADHHAVGRNKGLLYRIASDELTHARWILDLLESRNIKLIATKEAHDRYWSETLPAIEDFETGAAIGAHAEGMRLERIRAIVDDLDAPTDIREVFVKILKDEIFHEKAFQSMTTPEALDATRDAHDAGRRLLGLEP